MQQQYLQQQQLLLQQQQQVQQSNIHTFTVTPLIGSKTPTSNNGYFAAPAVRQPTQFGQAYMAGYSYSQNGQGYDQSQQAYGNMPQQAYANQQQIMSKPAPQYPPNQRRQ